MNRQNVAAIVVAGTLLLTTAPAAAERATLQQLYDNAQNYYSAFDYDKQLCEEVPAQHYVQAVKYIYAYHQLWLWTVAEDPPEKLEEIVSDIEQRALSCLQSYAAYSNLSFSGGNYNSLIRYDKAEELPPAPEVHPGSPTRASARGGAPMAPSIQVEGRQLSPGSSFSEADAIAYRRMQENEKAAWPAGVWLLYAADGSRGDDVARLVLLPEDGGRFRAMMFGDQPGEMEDLGVSDSLAYVGDRWELHFQNFNTDGGLHGTVIRDDQRTPVSAYRYGDQRLRNRPTFQ